MRRKDPLKKSKILSGGKEKSKITPLQPSDAVRKRKKLFYRIFSVVYCHNFKKYLPF